MEHKLRKRKPSTKGRSAAPKRRTERRRSAGEAEIALATLMALLHADRWLFEAAELARKAEIDREVAALNAIRRTIAMSLNRLQPRAYGAMTMNALRAGG